MDLERQARREFLAGLRIGDLVAVAEYNGAPRARWLSAKVDDRGADPDTGKELVKVRLEDGRVVSYRADDGRQFLAGGVLLASNERLENPSLASYLDTLTRRWTSYPSFRAMVEEPSSYFPTLRHDLSPELVELADAYDRAQGERGDARRAFRGGVR